MNKKRISRRQFVGLGAALGATAALVAVVPFATDDMSRTGEESDMQEMEMKSRVRGRVLLPGEEGYDAERAGWNTIVEHHPAMIVVAAGPDDVAAAVRHAVSADLPVAVQATGHGPSVPADGAVLINTRRMTDLEVDPSAGIARIGAGVKGGTVMEEVAPHGLAPLVASTPDIGVVGYLTSGGLPVLGRRYGFAADHVRALELVTADGELRRATADEHPDLFWAVRGGKGNFGVVTAVESDLVALSRLYGGGLFFPGAATGEVLGAWLEWTASQPEEMYSSVALRRFPDMPGIPDPVRGKFVVHVRVAYTGSAAEGERLLLPLRTLGPMRDTVADMPHARIGEVNSDPAGPAPIRDRGILLRELDEEAVERITTLAGPGADLPPGQIEIRHLGGALSRTPEPSNAISHRDEAKIGAVVDDIGSDGGKAIGIAAEITDFAAIERMRLRVEEEFGPVEVLAAFAASGGPLPGPTAQITEEEWRSAIDGNLTSAFLTLKSFLPGMIERRSGSIITMASSAGRVPTQAPTAYAAAKAGMVMLSRQVADEVGGRGVRVNCLAPDSILTERTRSYMSEDQVRQWAEAFPLGRMGAPEDVALATLFLASESSSWLTGVTLDVAGGKIML